MESVNLLIDTLDDVSGSFVFNDKFDYANHLFCTSLFYHCAIDTLKVHIYINKCLEFETNVKYD